MRLRLLTMSLLGRVFGALNARQSARGTVERDDRREQLLGDDAAVHEQSLRTRAFADDVASLMVDAPESRRRFW